MKTATNRFLVRPVIRKTRDKPHFSKTVQDKEVKKTKREKKEKGDTVM